MRVVSDLTALERGRPVILTIGAFDGVHRGHQYLIRQVIDRAHALGYDSVVLSFDPRPLVVLRPGSQQLTNGADKERIIADLDPDYLLLLPFNAALAQVPAGRFLDSLLERINLAEVWLGADFAFGHNREGNVDFLISAGQEHGFAVHVLARQQFDSEPLSSTVIRDLITAGDVARAAVLLGNYYRISGIVVRGAGRGDGLGFPTANVATAPSQLLPATGIYAGKLHIEQKGVLSAAVSVGFNPQFGGQELVIEAYALDFDGDLRGQNVGLDLVQRIRDEMKFESVDALVEAIDRDVQQTRKILDHTHLPAN